MWGGHSCPPPLTWNLHVLKTYLRPRPPPGDTTQESRLTAQINFKAADKSVPLRLGIKMPLASYYLRTPTNTEGK
jgi:hypothetical protein